MIQKKLRDYTYTNRSKDMRRRAITKKGVRRGKWGKRECDIVYVEIDCVNNAIPFSRNEKLIIWVGGREEKDFIRQFSC